MSAEDALAFVDTNVLVYALERSESPRKRIAQELLDGLMNGDRLRLSTQVMQELYITLTRKVAQPATADEALAILEDLAAWPVTTVDFPAIRAAVELARDAQLSFWDALVVVAAARAGAAVLYTEDLNHDQEILGVRINNPFRDSS